MKKIIMLIMLLIPVAASAHVGSHEYLSAFELLSHVFSEAGIGIAMIAVMFLVARKFKRK